MVAELLIHGAAFAFGVGAAILPVFLNAEVYVVAMGATMQDWMLFWGVMALSVGTVAGKALVFVLIRGGSQRFRREARRSEPRYRFTAWLRRVGDLLLTWLDRPVLGAATVLLSSLLAVPPLAVVTILAPLSRQRLWVFLAMVFLGRTAQFLALAFLVHGLDLLDAVHDLW